MLKKPKAESFIDSFIKEIEKMAAGAEKYEKIIQTKDGNIIIHYARTSVLTSISIMREHKKATIMRFANDGIIKGEK